MRNESKVSNIGVEMSLYDMEWKLNIINFVVDSFVSRNSIGFAEIGKGV